MNIEIEKLQELVSDLGDLDFQRMSKDGHEIYNTICRHLDLQEMTHHESI